MSFAQDGYVRLSAGFRSTAQEYLSFWCPLCTANVVIQYSTPLAKLPITPFKFDLEQVGRDTTFEVMCIVDGVPYQYGFAASSEEINQEWLFARPLGKPQRWFERKGQDWEFGDKLVGDKEVWRRATRPNALFLSTAIALNSQHLRPLFQWFEDTLQVVDPESFFNVNYLSPEYSSGKCKSEIIDFLSAADMAISDIRIAERKATPNVLPDNT